MAQPVGMVEPLYLGNPLGANRPPIQGRIWVALDLHDLSVFHLDPEPTPPVVHPGTIGFNNHFFLPFFTPEAQRTQRKIQKLLSR
jgi:hypothetical protein